MAIDKQKLVIDIEVKSNDTKKTINEINEAISSISDEAKKSSKKSDEAVNDMAKKYKKFADSLKKTVISINEISSKISVNPENTGMKKIIADVVEYKKMVKHLAEDYRDLKSNASEMVYEFKKVNKAIRKALPKESLQELNKEGEKTIDWLHMLKRGFQAVAAVGIGGALVVISTQSRKVNETFKAMNQSVALFSKNFMDSMKTMVFSLAGPSKFFDSMKTKYESFFQGLTVGAVNLGKVFKGTFTLSILGAVEAIGLLSPAILGLGYVMEQSENTFVQATGSVLKFAAVLFTSVGAAISIAMTWIGGLIESLGEKLISSIVAAQDKFIIFQAIMNQFIFTVKGFAREFGESAVGSLEMWNEQLEKLVDNTVFTRDELAKAMKLIVAEGTILGLAPKQMIRLSEIAADVASNTGRKITEVTQLMINSLSMTADSVLGLGIDIRDTTIENSKMLQSTGLLVDQLTRQEKVQIRLQALMKKTKPIMGAAASSIDTVSGQVKILAKEQEDLSRRLAETGTATTAYLTLLIKFHRWLNSIPKPLLDFIGNLKDFVGVSLIIIGKLTKYAFTLLGLVLAYKFAIVALKTYLGINIALGSVMTTLLTRILPITLAIWALIEAFQKLMSISPAFGNVIDSIGRSLGIIEDEAKSQNEELAKTEGILQKLGNFISKSSITVLIGLAQSMLFVQKTFLSIRKMFINDKSVMAEYNYEIIRLEKEMKKLSKDTENYGYALDFFSNNAMAATKSSKQYGDELKRNQKLVESFRNRVKNLADEMMKGFDPEIERQIALADRYDESLLKIKKLNNEMKNIFNLKGTEKETANKIVDKRKQLLEEEINLLKIRNQINMESDAAIIQKNIEIAQIENRRIDSINLRAEQEIKAITDQIEGLRRIGKLNDEILKKLNTRITLINKIAEIQKNIIRNQQKQTFKTEVIDKANSLIIETLRNQGKYLEAVKLENELRLKAFDERIEMMKKEMNLSEKQIEMIKKTRDAIVKANKAREKQAMVKPVKKEIIGGGEVSQLASEFGSIFNELGNSLGKSVDNVFSSIASKFTAMAASAAASVIGIILKIPDILTGVGSLVDKITDFPKMLYEAFGKLFDSLIRFVSEFLPNLIESIPKSIFQSGAFIDGITTAFEQLADSLPDVIEKAAEKMPDALIKIISAAIRSNRLHVILTKMIFSTLPKITVMLVKMIPEIIKAILTGIKDGIRGIFEDIPGQIEEGINSANKKLQKAFGKTSQLFRVSAEEMALGVPGATAISQGIIQAAKESMSWLERKWKELWDWLERSWRKLWDELEKLWDELWAFAKKTWDGMWKLAKEIWTDLWTMAERIWRGLWNFALNFVKDIFAFIDTAWKAIWGNASKAWDDMWSLADRVWKEIWNFASDLWDGIWSTAETIWYGMWNFAESMWNSITSNVREIGTKIWEGLESGLETFWDGAQSLGNQIWKGLQSGLETFWEGAQSLGNQIWVGLQSGLETFWDGAKSLGSRIWDGLAEGISGLGNWLKDILNSINPANLFQKMFAVDYGGRGTVEKALNIDVPFMAFAKGGVIPGNAPMSGDSSVNDRILALVSAGEGIVPRSVMDDPLLGPLMRKIIEGKFEIPAFGLGGIVSKATGGKVNIGGTAGKILDGDIKGAVKDLTKSMGLDQLWDIVKNNVFKDMFWKMIESNKFQTGGLVTGLGGVVEPGEFVISRPAVQSIGTDFLDGVNSRSSSASSRQVTQNFEFNIKIDAKERIDSAFVRTKLMPEIKAELRRDSIDGKRIIERTGVG